MLEVIMIALLSSCISSTKIKANLDYLRSLESEEIFSDNKGTYHKTIYPNGECRVEFEPNFPSEDYNPGNYFNGKETTINRLTEKYCPKE